MRLQMTFYHQDSVWWNIMIVVVGNSVRWSIMTVLVGIREYDIHVAS